MNLIQKLAKKVKNTIDEAILKRKLNIYVEREILDSEGDLIDIKESLEDNIKNGLSHFAFMKFERIQELNKRIEDLKKFREYVLNEKYYDEDR